MNFELNGKITTVKKKKYAEPFLVRVDDDGFVEGCAFKLAEFSIEKNETLKLQKVADEGFFRKQINALKDLTR